MSEDVGTIEAGRVEDPASATEATATIGPEERNALWGGVVVGLAPQLLYELVMEGMVDEAQTQRGRMQDNLRLLDDLGWHDGDERDSFSLTMSRDDLERTVRRLVEESDSDLSNLDHALLEGDDEELAEIADDALDVKSACGVVLEQLGGQS